MPTIHTDLTAGNQFEGGDKWVSQRLDFAQQNLAPGATLDLHVIFRDGNGTPQSITVTDTVFSENEQIYFEVGGSGGVGGGANHNLPYEWYFTDEEHNDIDEDPEELIVNPVEGTGNLTGISGIGTISSGRGVLHAVDLTDHSFTFYDIRLRLTVPNTIGSRWGPSFLNLEVHADSVTTP